MKISRLVLVGLLFVFLGCSSYLQQATENRSKISRLLIGMTKPEVLAFMGTEPFHFPFASRSTIQNPYRIEMMKSGENTYEIIYYFSDVKGRIRGVDEDELTPIILKNGKVKWVKKIFIQVPPVFRLIWENGKCCSSMPWNQPCRRVIHGITKI